MKKGFTLIELLVVIAIIGILSSVVLASLNSARGKAKEAAFRSELKALVAGLTNVCDSANIVAADAAATTNRAAGVINSQSCGSAGNTTFSVTFAPANGAACTSGTVTETAATFVGC
ncbi:MAG TPA: type II secretion system protein [Candidatus Paceibacterota bacterium]